MHQPKPVIFSVLTGIEINETSVVGIVSSNDRCGERSTFPAAPGSKLKIFSAAPCRPFPHSNNNSLRHRYPNLRTRGGRPKQMPTFCEAVHVRILLSKLRVGANPSEGGVNGNVAKTGKSGEDRLELAGNMKNSRRPGYCVVHRFRRSDPASKLVVPRRAGGICE